jgi:hypothetical protein
MTNIVYKSQVWEIVTVSGTGTVSLSGVAATGPYRTFYSAIPSGSPVSYSIVDTQTNAWERGIGTFTGTSSPGNLSRTSILESSNSNALVNFAGNPCNITMVISSPIVVGSGSGSAGLIPALNATGYLDATIGGTDAPFIEFFGGSTNPSFDNSAAILSAISKGYPVKFGPGTYYVAGNLAISTNAVLLGVRGATTVKRLSQNSNQSWIDFSCPIVYIDGIIFDCNSTITTPTSAFGIVVDSTVTSSFITYCQFLNNKTVPISQNPPASEACGLIYNSTSTTSTVISHLISSCIFSNNNGDGLWVANVSDISILDCISYKNGVNGISVLGDTQNVNPSRRIEIRGCLTYANGNGIFVNYVVDGVLNPPEDSYANPATIGAQVISNRSHNNNYYGIYIGNLKNGLINGNVCHDNSVAANWAAEILGDCAYFTEFSDNIIYGATAAFGIDAAGGYYCAFNNNIISSSASQSALNIGGSTGNSASGNRISNFIGSGIGIQQIEGGNLCFGVVNSKTNLINNVIDYTLGSHAIVLADNPASTLVTGNQFLNTNTAESAGLNAVRDVSSSAVYSGNSINGITIPTISVSASGGVVVVPDWAECVNLTAASSPSSPITAIQTETQQTVGTGIGYITMTPGSLGSGYVYGDSSITVTISDPNGSGFAAGSPPMVYNIAPAQGQIIGIRVGTPGTGYTAPTVSITAGSGSGAKATATVGVPWAPNRKISVVNVSAYVLTFSGSSTPSATSFVSPTNKNYTLQPLQSTSIVYQSNQGYISDNSRGIATDISINNTLMTIATPTIGVNNLNVSGTLTAASLGGGQFAGMRNRIINGSMAVDQRNNGSAQTIAPNAIIHVIDRWVAVSWSVATTGRRVAGSTTAQYLYQITGASGNTGLSLSQYIEAANCYDLAGQYITISFDIANSYLTYVDVQVCYASATDNWSISPVVLGTQTVAVTSTITRKSVSFQLPAAANTGLQVLLYSGSQPSGTFTVGNVQCELGTVATPFEQRPYGLELAMCQRYYYRYTGNGNYILPMISGAYNSYTWNIPFPTEMRQQPAITTSLTASNFVGSSPSTGQWGVALAGLTALTLSSGTPAISGVATVNGMTWICLSATFQATANSLSFNGLYFDASAELV